jgi:hypothetical protein
VETWAAIEAAPAVVARTWTIEARAAAGGGTAIVLTVRAKLPGSWTTLGGAETIVSACKGAIPASVPSARAATKYPAIILRMLRSPFVMPQSGPNTVTEARWPG